LQPRDSQGRGTEPRPRPAGSRPWNFTNLSSAQAITRFITDLGYSITTAKEDLSWAKARWGEMQNSDETAYDIVRRHSNKYYEWSQTAEATRELKLVADMLGRIERLRGLHALSTLVQVNNGIVQHNTTNTQVNYNLDALSLEELEKLQLLAAKIAPHDD
jgi:hypothetical protein